MRAARGRGSCGRCGRRWPVEFIKEGLRPVGGKAPIGRAADLCRGFRDLGQALGVRAVKSEPRCRR